MVLIRRSAGARAEWAAAARTRRAQLLTSLRKARVDLVEVATTSDVSEPIARCFARRAARHGRR